MTDFASIAKEASTVDETVMKILPTLGGLVGLIPGAQVAPAAAAGVDAILGVVDNALKLISGSNPGASFQDIINEFVSHNTPGQPASPALS